MIKNFLSLLIFSIVSFFPLNAYEHEVAIMSIFRDEADWLAEWIDYHLGIGVEHFYLYNHYSVDDYADVLKPYVESGKVDVIQWMDEKFPRAQFSAIKDAIVHHKKDVKWLALIDIDEFIVPHTKDDIRDFLQDFDAHAGLVINWQLFGTSNVSHLDRGESMLFALTWKFPTHFDSSWNSNRFVKSIIRPDRIDERAKHAQCGNHVFMPIQGYSLVNSDQQPQPIVAKNPSIVVDKIQLNHYFTRTYDWFYNTKISRREDLGDDAYSTTFLKWLLAKSHKEQDFSIQRLIK